MTRPFDPKTALPAIGEVRTPRFARWLGRFLLVAVVATPVILVFTPWQQTVKGRGRVIAFDPGQRQQAVTSTINGQIARWYVNETDPVKAGDKLVDIIDIDPEYGERLKAQRKLFQDQREQVIDQIAEQREVIQEQGKARDESVKAAEAGRDAALKAVETVRADIEAAKADADFKRQKFEQLEKLQGKGLESEIDVAEAKARHLQAVAAIAKLDQELSRARAEVARADAAIEKTRADGDAAVGTAKAALLNVEQELPSIERQLQQLDNQIRRYESRFITSPCDGTVHRIMPEASQRGQVVGEGQILAQIVPNADRRVVELYVEGVDASLITPDKQTGEYPRVRLQFEGWPAVQFTPGWPATSVGTFGGRVIRLDPTDDGTGLFRILVEAEPYFEDDEWPDPQYLRQGNQAVGWMFLRRVSLGFELWRRMNGFPPVDPPRKADPDDAAKPPKVKAS